MILPVIIGVVAALAVVAVGSYVAYMALRAARRDADANFSDCPVGGTEQPCPLQEDQAVRIVSIQFLEGDDESEIAGPSRQWVNLPGDDTWVDGTQVANLDRLTNKPRIRVRFNCEGAHSFTVRLEPADDNLAYSAAEKGRNGRFKHQEEDKDYTTEGDGTCIITDDIFLAVGGMDSYHVAAEDDEGNEVRSHPLTTWRLAYIKEVSMKDIPAADSTGTFVGEFARHGIHLEMLGRIEMDRMHNISTGDQGTYVANVRTAYLGTDAKDKEPYVVVVGYTDHLAVKNPSQQVDSAVVDVGPDQGPVDVAIRGPGLTNPAIRDRYLWNNLVPDEGWFVSAQFIPEGGGAAVAIAEDRCEAVAVSASRPDVSRTVRVDVSGLSAGRGVIRLRVNWVDRMRGGLAFGGGNLICVCTRAWWRDVSATDQNQVMIHEMGHKVGMVPDGTGILPDKTATYYDTSQGHVGPHCHKGIAAGQARYDSAADHAASECVMYGATNGKTRFCDECTPAVRKQDLTAGWSRL